jgi:proteic killer suppression protein
MRGITVSHAAKLARVLAALDAAAIPVEFDLPSFRLLPLKGWWSILVNGNWRIIFRFVGTDVELVDYLDYH